MNNNLISRSALLEEFEWLKMTVGSGSVGDIKDAIERIKKAPAVDAVEVVRCRDCKHWGTGYGGETEYCKVCEFANYMVGANGYCLYGEHKEDT